jgi:hypothetical protein
MGRIGPVIISACLAHDRASNARANWMEEIDRYGLELVSQREGGWGMMRGHDDTNHG